MNPTVSSASHSRFPTGSSTSAQPQAVRSGSLGMWGKHGSGPPTARALPTPRGKRSSPVLPGYSRERSGASP